VWLYRERLARAGIVEKLFEMFDAFLRERGYQAMGGQIIDASIVPMPAQRNSKEENAEINAGDTPVVFVDDLPENLVGDKAYMTAIRWTRISGSRESR